MTDTNILSKTISAAASLILLGVTAQAASATLLNGTTGEGELFLGIHATGGQGINNSVLIDLGSVATLSLLTAGQSATFAAAVANGSLNTDLKAQFGNTWYDRTDLIWAAVAAVQNIPTGGDPTNTLYGSVSGTGSFPLSTVGYTRAANGAQSQIANRVVTMANGTSGSFTNGGTQGSASNISIQTASDVNSWASWMPGGANTAGLGNNPYGGFNAPAGQAFEQPFTVGTLGSGAEGALDVYRMFKTGVQDGDLGNATSGAGSYQFTLEITSTGIVTAANLTPTPEPASICLLMAGGLCFLGMRRRRAHAGMQAGI